MQGKSKYSEVLHLRFLERFKGKITTIGKDGQMGITPSASKPIEKSPYRYKDVYSSSIKVPYLSTGLYL